MAIFEKMEEAVSNRDVEAYLALYSDDAVFVRHQSDTSMSKDQFGGIIRKLMASDETNMGNRRLIYENEDNNDYPDGTREAVLMACTLTDGKISRVETGATPLQK